MIELKDKKGIVAIQVTDKEVKVLDAQYHGAVDLVKYTGATVGIFEIGVVGHTDFNIGQKGSAGPIADELCFRTGLKRGDK